MELHFKSEDLQLFADVVRKTIKEELDKALNSPTLTRSQIAKEIGRSREWLSRNPWALPQYGRPDIEGVPELWWRESWDEWRKDLPGHKASWEAMSPREREEIIKIA